MSKKRYLETYNITYTVRNFIIMPIYLILVIVMIIFQIVSFMGLFVLAFFGVLLFLRSLSTVKVTTTHMTREVEDPK